MIAVLATVFGSIARAQSTATLSGTVTDSTSAVVAGATIKVHSLDTNADRETTTDSSGRIRSSFAAVPGNYMLQVTASGLDRLRCRKITACGRPESDDQYEVERCLDGGDG